MFVFEDIDRGYSGASAAQVGLVIREGGHEVLILRTTYRGPAKDFAWVIPVPRAPDGADGLFTASDGHIRWELRATRPQKVLQLPPLRSEGKGAALDSAAGGALAEDEVRVLSRRAVGKYDASVLAARDAGALTNWLKRNRYPMPDAARPIIAEYIEKGWVFVAMRVLDWVQAEKPVLDAVTPIGIRFQTETLVFPLAISKVSAPPKTTLILQVYDDAPVRCAELPVWHLIGSGPTRIDGSYEEYRERLVSGMGPGLLCEGLTLRRADFPGQYRDLPREERGARARQYQSAMKASYWATRLWGEVRREDMRDLTFAPDLEPREPFLVRVSLEVPPKVLASLEPGSTSALGAAADGLWRAGRYAVVPVFVLAWVVVRRRGRWAGPAVLGVLVAVLLVPALARAGGSSEVRERWTRELADAQKAIRTAVDAFAAEAGAYPATLSDLASGKPIETGLDASGNAIRLREPVRGTYLPALPVDLLTGRADTWRYSVSGEVTIQSGGFTTTVSRHDPLEAQDWQHLGPLAWTSPEYDVESIASKEAGHSLNGAVEPVDHTPESRRFWAMCSRSGGELWELAPAGEAKPWGVISIGNEEEAAVLLGARLHGGSASSAPACERPDGYVIAARYSATGLAIRQGARGRHELVRLPWTDQRPRPPETLFDSVSPDVFIPGANSAVAMRLEPRPSLVRVPYLGDVSSVPSIPVGPGMHLAACEQANALYVALEPSGGPGLGELWCAALPTGLFGPRTDQAPRMLARYYCHPGVSHVVLLSSGSGRLAVAWGDFDSPRSGVRVFELSGEKPRWLPVTTLPPDGGWDYGHYERARRWIERNAAESDVPVLPL